MEAFEKTAGEVVKIAHCMFESLDYTCPKNGFFIMTPGLETSLKQKVFWENLIPLLRILWDEKTPEFIREFQVSPSEKQVHDNWVGIWGIMNQKRVPFSEYATEVNFNTENSVIWGKDDEGKYYMKLLYRGERYMIKNL